MTLSARAGILVMVLLFGSSSGVWAQQRVLSDEELKAQAEAQEIVRQEALAQEAALNDTEETIRQAEEEIARAIEQAQRELDQAFQEMEKDAQRALSDAEAAAVTVQPEVQ